MEVLRIEAAVIVDAYNTAVHLADVWLEGACCGRPPTDCAQRQYDARLDALQDMMLEIEVQTGLELMPRGKLYDLATEQPGLAAHPSFDDEIVKPIKDTWR